LIPTSGKNFVLIGLPLVLESVNEMAGIMF
jgi:hypothetical protein